ncbi:MAG TPA: hypothetical protein VK982_04495 [Bacteroidales bacterium]|nr:hypothetical protein [Bacteroidales bacterium]
MRHSQEVHEAIERAFEELMDLNPKELKERLARRQTGVLAYLMQETETVDYIYKMLNNMAINKDWLRTYIYISLDVGQLDKND